MFLIHDDLYDDKLYLFSTKTRALKALKNANYVEDKDEPGRFINALSHGRYTRVLYMDELEVNKNIEE